MTFLLIVLVIWAVTLYSLALIAFVRTVPRRDVTLSPHAAALRALRRLQSPPTPSP